MSPSLLQPKRSESEVREKRDALAVAVAWRKIIWRQAANNEDERIDRLIDVCTRMMDGDPTKGKQLATDAIWSAS